VDCRGSAFTGSAFTVVPSVVSSSWQKSIFTKSYLPGTFSKASPSSQSFLVLSKNFVVKLRLASSRLPASSHLLWPFLPTRPHLIHTPNLAGPESASSSWMI
jgi:hypothetical protein